ncbi:serine hydrolase domain-containing protein [Chryseobacterium sp. PMSZPI]|uniref:serine hydrolase domain-containing protein n=1 Tax=Chryseobacterium sp. PMSZPI TaxID=1033900 RepID=UPI000C34B7E5|nr:serine hydrolase domain-containing protein [Chryseobacterium sp. PMSZPI]PKF73882.1 hypothetical protein CW752_12150 [Chryseobacterium sp. PMSZPI]
MKTLTRARNTSSFLTLLIVFSCGTRHLKTEKGSAYAGKIDSVMTKAYERGLFNGNVLVVKNNTIIYKKSFGFTDETKQTELNNKSIFNPGSIAKEFDAVSIMILVERGLLNLDDPIPKFNLGLPKWSEKVTIRHLINYASGIPKRSIYRAIRKESLNDVDKGIDTYYLLKKNSAKKYSFENPSELITYPGFPHGMPTTEHETINKDLLEFIEA